MKVIGALACLGMAFNCFANNDLQLGVPHWIWIFCGVMWLGYSAAFAFKR